MGYVYKYTDLEDNLVKYVGIVWSDNRTLIQRAKEHSMYDDWCIGKQWKIEYLEVENRTDCECLEGHFIALYGTTKWYNKDKSNWGVSKIYSMLTWEWKELEYTQQKYIPRPRESTGSISTNRLIKIYERSIFIFNNGCCYCFFKSFKVEPEYIFIGSSQYEKQFAIDNKIRYMNKEQLNLIINMIKNDNKPFTYFMMPEEEEQIKLENNLSITECITYKRKKKLMKDALRELEKKGVEITDDCMSFLEIRTDQEARFMDADIKKLMN